MSTEKILGALFRQNLAFFMNLRGMTQADLARELQVSRTQANRLVGGSAAPTLDTIEVLAGILKVPPYYFILHDLEGPELEHIIGKNYEISSLELAAEAMLKMREAKYTYELDEQLSKSMSEKLEEARRHSSASKRPRTKIK